MTNGGDNLWRLAFVLTVIVAVAAPALAQADLAGPATVIDGDTIEIEGQRIRLHGIDAPEMRQSCRLDGNPWRCGRDAASALAGKIASRAVTCQDRGTDSYRRIVAKCAVAGVDLGEWMVANGWAVAYYIYSYDYTRAEQQAKSARRGIWASEFDLPSEWRKAKR